MTDQGSRQQAERLSHQFFGKYRGVVADNKDPAQLGRLRVKVPSVLGDAEEAITDWAWPCVPCGGLADQGFFFIPEINAKVWVEFEEGNLDLPIWTGTFWSAPDGATEIPSEAQEMEDSQPQRHQLKTASGHVLIFCDEDGSESITLRHKDGASITLNEEGSVIIANTEGSHMYLNADAGEATLVDEHGNNIRLGDGGIAMTNADGALIDLSGESVQVVAKNIHLRSETVTLGEGAMEPAILGQSFALQYDTHIHPTVFGPSGPPLPVPMPLAAPVNTGVSKAVKVK